MLTKQKREETFKMMAENLPAIYYIAIDRQSIKGEEVLLTGLEIPPELEEEVTNNPDKEFTFNNKIYIPINHKRRIRRAYKRGGKKGVIAYLKPYLNPKIKQEAIKTLSALDI